MKKIFTLILFFALNLVIASAKTDATTTCPTATISYPGTIFCTSMGVVQAVIIGDMGGTFSSTPNLSINPTTGEIYPYQSSPGTYTVTYTLPSSPGCPMQVTTAYIVIEPAPTASISTSPPSICYGNTATINFTGTPNSTVTYTINGSSNQTITLNSSGTTAISTMPQATTTYNLVSVSTASGCSASATGSATITVNPIPNMTTMPGSASICSGSTPMITMNGSVPNTTFTWNCVQSGVVGASAGTGNMIMQTLMTTGNSTGQVVYTITPTANGCVGNPYQVYVTVFPNPVATATPSYEEISSGESTYITLSSTMPNTTYSWSVSTSTNNVNGASQGNGSLISQTLTLINPAVSGIVSYTITPSYMACYGEPIVVDVVVNPNLGVNSFDNLVFTLSPNPVVDNLSIKGKTILNHITVINQLGQQVLEKELNSNETNVDLSSLKTGIYFVTLTSENKQTTYKIIKQ